MFRIHWNKMIDIYNTYSNEWTQHDKVREKNQTHVRDVDRMEKSDEVKKKNQKKNQPTFNKNQLQNYRQYTIILEN